MILVGTADVTPVKFPSQANIARILEKELPWFARWLLDWEIPKDLLGDSRFGVKHFADATLLETSRQSSPTAAFSQILELWKHNYFKDGANGEFWEGTALQLQMAIILSDPGFAFPMKAYNVNSIGRHLASMVQKGAHIEFSSDGINPVWKIYRDSKNDGKSN